MSTIASAQIEEHRDRRVTFAVVLAVAAIVVSLAAVVVAPYVDNRARQRDAQSTINRRADVGRADFSMCSKLYFQIYAAQAKAIRGATVSHYHAILPDVPVRSLKNLVKNDIHQAHLNETEFDPVANCTALRTFRFIPGSEQAHLRKLLRARLQSLTTTLQR